MPVALLTEADRCPGTGDALRQWRARHQHGVCLLRVRCLVDGLMPRIMLGLWQSRSPGRTPVLVLVLQAVLALVRMLVLVLALGRLLGRVSRLRRVVGLGGTGWRPSSGQGSGSR